MELPPVVLEPFDGTQDVSAWFDDVQFIEDSAYATWSRDTVGRAFLGMLDGVPVSFLHHTNPKHDGGSASASVVVDPEQRGKGVGAATLAALTIAPHLHGARVVGTIDVGNASSIRCAERAGFTRTDDGTDQTLDKLTCQSRPEPWIELVEYTGQPDVRPWIEDGGRDRDVNRREEFVGDYLATHEGEPIGFVRVAGDDYVKWIRAFGLAPEKRGQGFARPVIQEVIRAVVKNPESPTEELDVRFPESNAGAERCYLSQGFVPKPKYSGGGVLCLKFQLAG